MPDIATPMTISAMKESTNGVALAAPDLPAFAAFICSMVVPWAASQALPRTL